MTHQPKNEGEGSRTAANKYNKETRHFVDNKDVGSKARDARDAIERDDEGALAAAEKCGKDKAREFDPQVHRDR